MMLARLSLLTLAACASSAAPPPSTPPMTDHQHHHGVGMPHRFEDADEWAKVFDDPARDAWQKPDEVVTLLALTPGMTVADLGAGTGYFLARLSTGVGSTGHVIATDIEPDMVRYLTERATREHLSNVRAVLAPPDAPGLDPASADRILVVDVWHHLSDRPAYASRLAATLRPGGFIAIVDFTLEAERGPPPSHRLGPDAIIADLTSAGLTATLADETLPDQYVVIARAR